MRRIRRWLDQNFVDSSGIWDNSYVRWLIGLFEKRNTTFLFSKRIIHQYVVKNTYLPLKPSNNESTALATPRRNWADVWVRGRRYYFAKSGKFCGPTSNRPKLSQLVCTLNVDLSVVSTLDFARLAPWLADPRILSLHVGIRGSSSNLD